ncbi:ATP-binding cassette domain-containing protein [Sinirhodobacter populi]|uniref:ATP-binding cassette domain-containing protein n=1 Tax=Paenirhodobacter populi TaxID=2306993 RepID=A0A443KQM3_9RHOB|nr:ATP-binding cassette domain-containing protein [Sinirhodobacter populi]RWR35220.1 ATP-binding cassette domain-containing protein [Sinirhodobacter populi]
MTVLLQLAWRIFRDSPKAFLRGAALGVTVLAMGAALLGLSGWFVTASAAAGIAGIGIGFDFFRPSAGVRFLALGRAGARYGERMLTHDATLQALAMLRGRLYGGVTRLPYEAQTRLRGAEALNRLTSDVDALDGLLLRLVLPAISVTVVLGGAFLLLWWLVSLPVAAAVLAVFILGGGVALRATARNARAVAEADETALQDLRARTLDLAQSRADLAVAGALAHREAGVSAAIDASARQRNGLERVDRAGGAALSMTTAAAAAAALAVGGMQAQQGAITPATAAIGFFAALALGEGMALLRRGLAELGRMESAAVRVMALAGTPARPAPARRADPVPGAPLLSVEALTCRRAGAARDIFAPVSFTLHEGETLLLTGPSGAGKSTLLSILAGLIAPDAGAARLMGHAITDWPEAELRDTLTLVPQRSALIAGTVRENLSLALPQGTTLDEARAWEVLDTLALGAVLRARGGLDTRLGAGGSGLSGGQSRRLCLARAILRAPKVLLLDEPTEGLDPATAHRVLTGLRRLLPETGILIVSHRREDIGTTPHHIRLFPATTA